MSATITVGGSYTWLREKFRTSSKFSDTQRMDWLDKQDRNWTFWLGYTHKHPYSGHTTWPVFPGKSIREAIDRAMELEYPSDCPDFDTTG